MLLQSPYTTNNTCGAQYNAVLWKQFSAETSPLLYIPLADAQAWCSVDSFVTDAGNFFTFLIPAALEMCEAYANKSFIKRTVKAEILNPNGNQYLPYGPVIGSMVSVKDNSGNTVTNYSVVNGRVVYGSGVFEYLAGYEVADLPKELKTIWLQQITWMWDNRGEKVETGLAPMVKTALNKYRVI